LGSEWENIRSRQPSLYALLQETISWYLFSAVKTDSDIQLLMRDIDRTLLRENLKLTPAERPDKFASFMRFISELRRAGGRMRAKVRSDSGIRETAADPSSI
jgi:hypothetical protein